MMFNYIKYAFLLAIATSLFAYGASAAKLTPIPAEDALTGVFICKQDPSHFFIGYGDWTACCTEDPQTLKPSCVVCDKDKNCSDYSEFKNKQELFNLLELGSGLKLAPAKPKNEKKKSK